MKHSLLVFVFQVPLFLFGAIPQHSDEYYEAIKPEVREAQRKGAKAKIIYRVVDDEGTPITNTVVHGIWQNDYPRKTWEKKYVTDKDGVFVAEQKIGGKFGCVVKKEGFYSSYDAVDFHWRKGFLLCSKTENGNRMVSGGHWW